MIEGPWVQWRGRPGSTRTTEAALIETNPRSAGDALADVEEKLVGANNLQPIAALELALKLSDAVVLITVPGRGTATGFLVGADLLLTNHHVLRSEQDAAHAYVRTRFQYDIAGRLTPSEFFPVRPDVFFQTDADLDFTLVGLAGGAGSRYGVISLGRSDIAVGQSVAIIQHPLGQPKQVALSDNEVAYTDARVVQYLTDTLPGSSGSPVFDETWQLVALHHSGGWIPEPTSTSTHFRNEGIRIGPIIDALVATGAAHR